MGEREPVGMEVEEGEVGIGGEFVVSEGILGEELEGERGGELCATRKSEEDAREEGSDTVSSEGGEEREEDGTELEEEVPVIPRGAIERRLEWREEREN